MDFEKLKSEAAGFSNLKLLANTIVEGYISGLHKSPFHGFSAEFSEHKIYNQGESTRHIDWKLFAKTDKLYTKRYDEETNLRCHLIVDNSSSMHYPKQPQYSPSKLNKISFSVLACAVLLQLLKKQRDAVGLSVYSDKYDFYFPDKGSERHFNMLYQQLHQLLIKSQTNQKTQTYQALHQIAENIHRRSLVFLFTDLWQSDPEAKPLFEALRHLKYNKHEVVLFHVTDVKTEHHFDFTNSPMRYKDVETGESIALFAAQVKSDYKIMVADYNSKLQHACARYKIKYVPVDIANSFDKIMTTYFYERRMFI